MIRILCFGRLKLTGSRELANKYLKRIQPHIKCEIIEWKDMNAIKASKKIKEFIKEHNDEKHILLDERGKIIRSELFSEIIFEHVEENQTINFYIGVAEGFTKELKDTIKEKLALSTMTFPHDIARILLIEQIYRACAIKKNIPYHKD